MLKNVRTLLFTAIIALPVSAEIIVPTPPIISAKGFLLIDYNTGRVLAENNADMRLAPASLTKMMTSYIAGKEVNSGNIHLEDQVLVSEKAWAKNMPGSSLMHIEVGKYVSVADLKRGIIIQSGNDACIAIAEHIAGSEDAFVQLMNGHAEALGMTGSHFANSHGLDHPEHYTTPRDMAIIAKAIIKDLPAEHSIYAEKSFTYNNIKQHNRNSLLWDKSLDVDGMKTGHTDEAGYSLVATATKDNMRLISVVMGTETIKTRSAENKKLLSYGFRFFETITPYKAGAKFADQRVWKGSVDTVQLGILQDTPITIPRGKRKQITAEFTLSKALIAPLTKAEQVGTLALKLEDEVIASYPLVVLQTIDEGGFFSRMIDTVKMKFDDSF